MDPRPSLVPPRCGGLVNKINAGECVLVLGPRVAMPADMCPGGETPIAEYLSRKLLEALGEEKPEATSLRDALTRYEQQSPSSLRSLYQELVSTLDPYTTDLHRDLASLPFRLVLAATPDRMMANAFREVGKTAVIEAHYDYCHAGPSDLSSLPSSRAPVVYSLFGRHDHPESMVLTDRNLVDYLVRLTKGSPALPDPVRATLKAPSTLFLFVGFGFTNWWLRLLLKVLDITGVENRLLSLALEDTGSFGASEIREHRGFFESAGIYIHAGDWSALARELASRYRENVARTQERTNPAPATTRIGRRPLVFLSYASEDADTVNGIRQTLEHQGVSVWLDSNNLRAGQNWSAQIADYIKRVDYFVFVQTRNMDGRDERREDGVYNRELQLALNRARDKPFGTVFVIHAVIGQCRSRTEPELESLHRIQLDSDGGVEMLASHILESFVVPVVAGAQAVQTA